MDKFSILRPNQEFIDSIFAYDTRTLEATKAITISKYIIALSQYLIYFKSKFNETKMNLTKNNRLLEITLSSVITAEDIKKYKTKKEARIKVIYSNATLNKIQLDVEAFHDEVILLEGVDKTISELIAAFKRELTRRENELYQHRNS